MSRRFDDDGDIEHELIDLGRNMSFEEKCELMEKLLDSESTLLSKRMRDWLVKEGKYSLSFFLSFLF